MLNYTINEHTNTHKKPSTDDFVYVDFQKEREYNKVNIYEYT